MNRALAVLVALGVSTSAFAGFHGPVNRSVALVPGKSMNGVHGQGSFVALHFDFARAFLPRTEATWGIAPMWIEQPSHFFVSEGSGSEHVQAIQFTLGLRHHFGDESKSTRPFVEIGSGPMWSTKRVPATSSRFNFDSYGTVGATFRARNGWAPFAGLRVQHISNAGYVADRNPGYNIGSIVLGVRFAR